tara:strand:+ start:607 stop:2112 length:1506 start_codon:yes stop_codon:yes gene_type:complete
MEKLRLKQEIKFHLGLNILIAIFITIASYVHIPFGNFKACLIYLCHFLLLQFSVFGFVYIFSLFHKIFRILFPVLFLIIASLSFWVYTQDITIGVALIQATLEANMDIAIDVLSLEFILYLSVALVSLLLWIRKFKHSKFSAIKSPLLVVAIIGVSVFFLVENYKYGTLKRKLPYNVYYSFVSYLKKPNLKLKDVKENILTKEENLHIIFVLGESLRADHLSLNGYNRNTLPKLTQQKNLVSFQKVHTPLTYTAISVPQILTDKSINETKSRELVSLYSVLEQANFSTEWIGNQSLEKSYENIVNTNKSVTIIDKFHSVLSFKKQKDLNLLQYFSVDSLSENNKISTLHMIGSHWYYNSRINADFEHFKPIVASKYVGASTKEQLINSYDNTILYLDYFLNDLINKLEKSSKKTILIYLSDHGETLGEDGKWFHAQEHKASKNPAMLVWFSDNFEKSYPLKVDKMKLKKNDSITTDFLFHSILDLSNIQGFKYQKEQSIFN